MIRILVATLTGKYIKVDIAQDAMVKVRNCTLGCNSLAVYGALSKEHGNSCNACKCHICLPLC
jgi:hypothetical protein